MQWEYANPLGQRASLPLRTGGAGLRSQLHRRRNRARLPGAWQRSLRRGVSCSERKKKRKGKGKDGKTCMDDGASGVWVRGAMGMLNVIIKNKSRNQSGEKRTRTRACSTQYPEVRYGPETQEEAGWMRGEGIWKIKRKGGTGRNAPKSRESDTIALIHHRRASSAQHASSSFHGGTFLGWDRTELGVAAEDGTGQWIVGSMQRFRRSIASHWAREVEWNEYCSARTLIMESGRRAPPPNGTRDGGRDGGSRVVRGGQDSGKTGYSGRRRREASESGRELRGEWKLMQESKRKRGVAALIAGASTATAQIRAVAVLTLHRRCDDTATCAERTRRVGAAAVKRHGDRIRPHARGSLGPANEAASDGDEEKGVKGVPNDESTATASLGWMHRTVARQMQMRTFICSRCNSSLRVLVFFYRSGEPHLPWVHSVWTDVYAAWMGILSIRDKKVPDTHLAASRFGQRREALIGESPDKREILYKNNYSKEENKYALQAIVVQEININIRRELPISKNPPSDGQVAPRSTFSPTFKERRLDVSSTEFNFRRDRRKCLRVEVPIDGPNARVERDNGDLVALLGGRQVASSVLPMRKKSRQIVAKLAVARFPSCTGTGEGAAMALGSAAIAQRARTRVERRLFIILMSEGGEEEEEDGAANAVCVKKKKLLPAFSPVLRQVQTDAMLWQSGLQNHDASEHKKASREHTWFIRIPQAEDFSSHFLNIHSIYDLFQLSANCGLHSIAAVQVRPQKKL
ncbi:hypothetical protein B0H13DRAFT_1876305 [Mycena leptocephala]|nr:hypothetical protein B0H13DRAFT_1876305 [Mycena leptocephala]